VKKYNFEWHKQGMTLILSIMRRFAGSPAVCFGMLFFCIFSFQKTGYSQDTILQKEPSCLILSGGVYSCLDLWATTGFINVQFQPGKKIWVLYPQGGIMASLTGAFMVYAGLTYPAMPIKWLVIKTSAGGGYYANGNGIDLGCPFEFRISFAILFRFRNLSQIGVEIAHMSNANLSTHNPGTETISVIFQLPLH
jgi:hypothetical protein